MLFYDTSFINNQPVEPVAELEFFEKEDEYLAQAVLENMNLNDNQVNINI